jgi:hypothetical protein
MPFVLESDPATAPRAVLDLEGHPELDGAFLRGIALGPLPPLTVRLLRAPEAAFLDYFECPKAPVISARMKDRLIALGVDNIETVPCVIVDERGRQPVGGYQVLNVVGLLDLIDRDGSDLALWRSKVARIKRLALRNITAMPGLCRMAGYPDVLMLDDALGNALKAAGLLGLRLTPAEGWSDSHRF